MTEPRDLAEVPQLLFDRIWAILKSLDEREKHFNDLQARYRTLASTWLLATFAGIGFMFSDKVEPPIPREIVSVMIAVAGAIGISLLWLIDVLIYHDLLIAGYAVGKQLEDLYPWLPPVRSNFSLLTRGPAVRWYVAAFYLAGIAVTCLIGSGICVFWKSPQKTWWLVAVLAVGIFLDSVIVYFTCRALQRKRDLPHWSPHGVANGA